MPTSDNKIISAHNGNSETEVVDSEWVASGKLGTRDAVLKFRTNILNSDISATSEIQDSNSDNNAADSKNPVSGSSTTPQLFDGRGRSNSIVTKSAKESAESEDTEADLNESGDFQCDSEYSNHEADEGNIDLPYSRTMPAHVLKITYKFMQTETRLIRKIFNRHGLTEVQKDENFSILWTGVHIKPDILRNLAPYQRVNHFPRSYELTRKDRLYKNIVHLQHLHGFRSFDFVPQSYMLPKELKELASAHNKQKGPWIVKPAASSRGRGIYIVNAPDQIDMDEPVIVSRYIVDTLCIDGHKCDIRIYVLVTSFDPLVIYIYEEGLVRLATVKYDRREAHLWNPCMHLCNYSINKYHMDYIKPNDDTEEDIGHKWTLSALLRHLRVQGHNVPQLMANIEDLIIKSILACSQTVIAACRMFVPSGNNCFELYGFDILVDNSLKPWLLEVNLSPSMGVDSGLDTRVKACLLTDLLTCVGIPAFSTSTRDTFDKKWTRFRSINFGKRTSSADSGNKRPSVSGSQNLHPLTTEEQRIVRNACMQNARRGGFVRIFPAEDTMQRYGHYLDTTTGIPLSTSVAPGQNLCPMVLPHNYNQVLFDNLYGKNAVNKGAKEGNSAKQRYAQYERALANSTRIVFCKKNIEKSEELCKNLRAEILSYINSGSELTQLQARQTFSRYLEAVLHRLTKEPRDFHEKLILKFLNRIGGAFKTPVLFKNPENAKVVNKARSAMVAKLLSDFLEQYIRDTEAYIDSFEYYNMIPTKLYNDFLNHALESDLEHVLALITCLTGLMPYLYNRYGLSVPPTPPIPSGQYGFLRALPAMVARGTGSREFHKCESYLRIEKANASGKCDKLPYIAANKKRK
ncbi:tubulin polyglutamylase ttll6 isoform X2 [Teleopsis dalmanni]|uniref:tubulin polyglutamylase ttll6 isoform X2 n=1 Tax=Teleopsis dalmanni TaxID=139649 RepID=UPI0018CDA603|nr:tubulin polyglutamylase ttll6 isoform X2 [Teleopsis dalmanni]